MQTQIPESGYVHKHVAERNGNVHFTVYQGKIEMSDLPEHTDWIKIRKVTVLPDQILKEGKRIHEF